MKTSNEALEVPAALSTWRAAVPGRVVQVRRDAADRVSTRLIDLGEPGNPRAAVLEGPAVDPDTAVWKPMGPKAAKRWASRW
jgi:hypothetical protein